MFPGTGPDRRPVPTVPPGRAAPAARTGAMPHCRPPGGCRPGPSRHPDSGCPAPPRRSTNRFSGTAANVRERACAGSKVGRAGAAGADPDGAGIPILRLAGTRVLDLVEGRSRYKPRGRSGSPATPRVNAGQDRPYHCPAAGPGRFGAAAVVLHMLGCGGIGDRRAIARAGNSVPPRTDSPALPATAAARPPAGLTATAGGGPRGSYGIRARCLPAARRGAPAPVHPCSAGSVPWSGRW
jgi:hypothetical protein